MSRRTFKQWLLSKLRLAKPIKPRRYDAGRAMLFETPSERITPAVNAFFTAASGTLTVNGDHAGNTIVVSRDAAGQIFVNGGAVAIKGGPATIANTNVINVTGGA